MNDMEYAKYSTEIRDILEIVDEEGLTILVRNVVKYVCVENRNDTNWLAHELFMDVIPNDDIIELFDV